MPDNQGYSRSPVRNADAETITALVKESGTIVGYKLSSGRVVGKEEGVQLTKEGCIRGVTVAEKNGTEYLRSQPDGSEQNNLGNLPSISIDR